jgi:hypothetical protein
MVSRMILSPEAFHQFQQQVFDGADVRLEDVRHDAVVRGVVVTNGDRLVRVEAAEDVLRALGEGVDDGPR